MVSSLGKIWLFKIAPADWHAPGGREEAMVGPLPHFQAQQYEARYLESIKLASSNGTAHTPVHRHPGVEAWYVISGAHCLQIPGKTFVVHAGETGLVPAGAPMVLTPLSAERALVLVLQDASQPWMTRANDWQPSQACPK